MDNEELLNISKESEELYKKYKKELDVILPPKTRTLTNITPDSSITLFPVSEELITFKNVTTISKHRHIPPPRPQSILSYRRSLKSRVGTAYKKPVCTSLPQIKRPASSPFPKKNVTFAKSLIKLKCSSTDMNDVCTENADSIIAKQTDEEKDTKTIISVGISDAIQTRHQNQEQTSLKKYQKPSQVSKSLKPIETLYINEKLNIPKSLSTIRQLPSIKLSNSNNNNELVYYERLLNAKMNYLFQENEADFQMMVYNVPPYSHSGSAIDIRKSSRMKRVSRASKLYDKSELEGEIDMFSVVSSEYKPYQDPLSKSERRAQNYLINHKIYEFFEFLGAHLVAASPENPVEFLINLLRRCLEYRINVPFIVPPLLFGPKHVESLYFTLDPMNSGLISFDQYVSGMHTLGVKEFDEYPLVDDDLMVEKDQFINEACKRLLDQFTEMIQSFEPETYKQELPCNVPLSPRSNYTTPRYNG